jgi:hypothetical protein
VCSAAKQAAEGSGNFEISGGVQISLGGVGKVSEGVQNLFFLGGEGGAHLCLGLISIKK